MKNYLKSTLAFGVALSMLAGPAAFAQQDQHNNAQNGQHAVAPQHAATQHAPVQHQTMQQHAQVQQHAPMQTHPQTLMQNQTPQHQTMQAQHQPMQPQHQQMSEAHHWQHGQHYNGSRRVVSNWQSYHLRQPPHGYEWVQDGSQFVLIAVASGIIADVLLNSAYQ